MDVQIWSDIVCPWCYLGKHRFERALESFEHGSDVRVVWRSFQLDPHAPDRDVGTAEEVLAEKVGDPERAREMQRHVAGLGADEGLEYRFDLARSGNTFRVHRLVHLAARHGAADAAVGRLFRGYFAEGLPIADPDAVARAVAEVGVPEDEAREVAHGDAYADEVREDLALAASYGVSGVPFFVLDGRYGVSGAQSSETFLRALRQAWDERGAPRP